jgi:hypothetical protein
MPKFADMGHVAPTRENGPPTEAPLDTCKTLPKAMACNEDEYRSQSPCSGAKNRCCRAANRSSSATADAALEFGRFRVQLCRRQLLADGVPVELGTRAFDLLLVLLKADGLLITKEELLSRVWPGLVVSEENLKVQVSALRRGRLT